jgi:hypothetical protein
MTLASGNRSRLMSTTAGFTGSRACTDVAAINAHITKDTLKLRDIRTPTEILSARAHGRAYWREIG